VKARAVSRSPTPLAGERLVGFMLTQSSSPCRTPRHRRAVADAGFGLLATSDHFQPWQANEGHSGEAWVTMEALGARIKPAWMGTTVTCYHPAVVTEAFATLA
jgi:alkanesulfonate monooxygenase SsuD/methylene tetrahydromethanopterin reductase-like flavin-dependent oxidoreductase (luciferase family)